MTTSTRRLAISLALALPLAAVLAGCAAGPTATAPDTGAAYLAMGQEPGWTLEITPERLNYAGDYGQTRLTAPHRGAQAMAGGRRYRGGPLDVRITAQPCADSMSGQRFADTVLISVDGKTLAGCGGAVLAPAELVGTQWRFVSIGGTPVDPDRPTELAFDGERVSGTVGCNRFGGDYSSDGRRLTFGALVMTRMACMGPVGEQERNFVALASGPVSLRFLPSGEMVLMGAVGTAAVLKPTF